MSTIASISTPNAAGGIGMVRITGENAIPIADGCFRPVSGKALRDMKGYTAAYGTVFDGDDAVDDAVAIVYRAPKSYTGEDTVELCCHGGLYLLQQVLRLVYRRGAVPAEPGEYTKRAFLNGKMDLSQAESVMQVIGAQGSAALTAAENTLRGSVSRRVDGICRSLIAAAAGLAAWADYPEDDVPAVEGESLADAIESAAADLRRLLKTYDNGKAVTQGVATAICGKPNVGKSTLMNLLSGTQRSIVTNVAGTTRDAIEETVRVGDILLHLIDTAGIRDTSDVVEQIGVNIAKQKLAGADLVFLLFDASRPADEEDLALMRLGENKRCIAVLNKTDLGSVFDPAPLKAFCADVLRVSAYDPATVETVQASLEKVLGVGGVDFSQEMLAGERQRACCEQALRHLTDAETALQNGVTYDAVGVEIDCAIDALLTLTGKKASAEVVDEVFRRFCVGK